jgi:hypothetical protein
MKSTKYVIRIIGTDSYIAPVANEQLTYTPNISEALRFQTQVEASCYALFRGYTAASSVIEPVSGRFPEDAYMHKDSACEPRPQ